MAGVWFKFKPETISDPFDIIKKNGVDYRCTNFPTKKVDKNFLGFVQVSDPAAPE
jgi:hypothetical protein